MGHKEKSFPDRERGLFLMKVVKKHSNPGIEKVF